MGQYVVLIYENEQSWVSGDPAVIEQGMKEHGAFAQNAAEKLRGGQALQPTSTATTIRKNGSGGFAVTDGPFVETKEALGGFYVIEAADLDEAIALAKQVPAPFGGVEVRPVLARCCALVSAARSTLSCFKDQSSEASARAAGFSNAGT